MQRGVTLLVAGGDVEEAELVRARRIIGPGGLHRVAGVDQIDEVDSLHDTAVLDVETGDDAGLEAHEAGCLLSIRSHRRIAASVGPEGAVYAMPR